MIVKKIESDRVKPKGDSIRDLTDYIAAPHTVNPQEKVLYAGGRGFLCSDHKSQQAEMVALASEAFRSLNPVDHFILSWREGEQPSLEQIEEIVTIFLTEPGLKGHQVLYGLHQDTDNLHLHLAINRVHPASIKVVEVNKGFDLEAAHQAIARIEHVQGWEREANGRYVVLENGNLGREPGQPEAPRQPGQRKRDMENRTGEKSAQRIAIEEAAPLVQQAKSWDELHQALAARGMRYERVQRGAVIFVNEVGVKAGSADRLTSLPQLQKRLGPYEPAPPTTLKPVVRPPEPILEGVPEWERYITGRKAYHADKEAALQALRLQQEADWLKLSLEHRAIRHNVLSGSWKGLGEALNALRSVLAAGQAADKAALQELHRKARGEVRRQYRPYPDLEQWQWDQARPEVAEQWRQRASAPQRMLGTNAGGKQGKEGKAGKAGKHDLATPQDIRAYRYVVRGAQVHYFHEDHADTSGQGAFVDLGKAIEVHDWRNPDATLAAMQLSAQKWGSFKVTGSHEFKSLCARLAAAHGFALSNPELHDTIALERERLQRSRQARLEEENVQAQQQPLPLSSPQALALAPLQQFERYAQAVGAQRYRVTSVRLKPGGGAMTFVLDKKSGVYGGFTLGEVKQRMAQIERLSERGQRIDYTPLSEGVHHVLVGAMGQAQLDRLLLEGYRPAAVLQITPERFEAIINVEKLGYPHDEAVGRRLAEQLNLDYGNPALRGCIQPHPAPGFADRQRALAQADGASWEVRLVTAQRCECPRARALALEISADISAEDRPQLGQEIVKAAAHPERTPQPGPALASATAAALEAYGWNYQDVLSRHPRGRVDLSRVDSTIAVRLRVTGHAQQAIEDAVRLCAPVIRQKPQARDWPAYAQRAARFAFSAAGDLQAAVLEEHRQELEMLEGRNEEHTDEQNMEQAVQRRDKALDFIGQVEALARKTPRTGAHPKRPG